MPELDVSGATLHYQIRGQGPLFLCISGANGDYEIWERLAGLLKESFTVAFYDRRGFSRSYLNGAQDYSQRLETDADDAATLIRHLSPTEPATVLGSSSGAIVALTLLLRHPDQIRLLISHEPPAFKLQSGTEELFAEQTAIYDTYRAQGMLPAMQRFVVMVKAGQEAAALQGTFDARSGTYRFPNAMYWFERELRQYVMADLSPEKFRPLQSKLLTVNAELTAKDSPQYRANETLAKALGAELVLLPGAHVGYVSHAAPFAKALTDVLRKRDNFYEQLLS